MIKIKFISKLALTLAAGMSRCRNAGVDASAQPPMPLITVIIGDPQLQEYEPRRRGEDAGL